MSPLQVACASRYSLKSIFSLHNGGYFNIHILCCLGGWILSPMLLVVFRKVCIVVGVYCQIFGVLFKSLVCRISKTHKKGIQGLRRPLRCFELLCELLLDKSVHLSSYGLVHRSAEERNWIVERGS